MLEDRHSDHSSREASNGCESSPPPHDGGADPLILLFAFLQPLDVDDPQLPAADLDDAVGFQAIDLAGHGSAVRADAGGDLVVRGGGPDHDAVAEGLAVLGQSQ